MSAAGAPAFAHGIVWLRRDLRLDDHVALAAAARACARVTCAFVLDPPLLRGPRVGAPIVQFFFDALAALRMELRALGSELALLEGDAGAELGGLARRLGATALFYNEDYDPAMRERDAAVTTALAAAGLVVRATTDHVYAPAAAIVRDGGAPYVVYTPYRRRWERFVAEAPHAPVDSRAALHGKLAPAAAIGQTRDVPRPDAYGHASSSRYPAAGAAIARGLLHAFVAGPLAAYGTDRNVPALAGTSGLSPHLRAGTIGIRTCVHAARGVRGAEPWLGELAWRDFYQQLLFHVPHIASAPFAGAAERIPYRDDPAGFAAWCEGRTGYPIVDAGMRQLARTGWMHNRVRMIAASFLTKHLLIDYRRGERWFEQRLADADLAANNGGWQWSASTGTDAAPYFRVFNPALQAKRFDPDGRFVHAWVPEIAAGTYPPPIVDHAFARARAIDVYGAALSAGRKGRT